MGKNLKKLKDIRREYVKKYFTGNLGKVVEEEDKLVCYVNKKKCKKSDSGYVLNCHGITDADIQIANMYGLNKPIYYVIDKFSIKRDNFNLVADNDCKVVLRDSVFRDLAVSTDNDCYFDNVRSRSISPLTVSAKNISIKNSDLRNFLSLYGIESLVELQAENNLCIKNSTIGKNDQVAEVNISCAKHIDIKNSKLRGNEIVCTAPNIDMDDESSVVANEKIVLKSDDLEDFNTYAPTVIYDISKNGDNKVLRRVNRKW